MSRKRNCLTLLEKYKIIQDMDEKKTTQVEMAQQHGIPCSTLGSILKMREEIVNAVQKEGHNLLARSLKGARHGDLDEILWEWYGQQRAQGILLNGPMMQRKANELAVRLGIENFRCSNGWLDRFRARHGMHRVKRVHGKSLLINPRSKREQFLLVRNVLSRYQPEDVYSADELGMFHNLMPDRTLSVKGNKYKDVKRSKERRLTVLLCCNMDGSDKLKPLVIGKFKKPHSLEDNILPCDYDFNEEVEMTSAVFMRWLACFDTKMSNSDRKVALFINSCVAYPDAVKFRNVELVIMPKNGTSMLRPLDQGILQQVKVKLREMFVRSMVYELDVGKQVKKWDVLRAMEGIVASWNAVKRAVIANCFRDADFIPPIKEEAADIVPSNVAGTEHFAPTLDEEAAIVVLPTIDDAETPDDPLQLDTKPQMGPFMEQQPGLSTAPTTVTVTVVQPCDEKMWQKLSTDSMYDEFIILDDDVGVEGTTDSSIIVEGQQVGEKEMEEDPGDLPTRRDVLKAGYIYSSMLRRLDASEQIWTQFNNVKDFVEQTCSKKQTLITDFFKK